MLLARASTYTVPWIVPAVRQANLSRKGATHPIAPVIRATVKYFMITPLMAVLLTVALLMSAAQAQPPPRYHIAPYPPSSSGPLPPREVDQSMPRQIADSFWDLNGSVMRLQVRGDEFIMRYEVPRIGLLQVGVQPGDVVLIGRGEPSGMVVGTAYIHTIECGKIPYEVQGHGAHQTIYVAGNRPRIGLWTCQLYPMSVVEQMTFVYRGSNGYREGAAPVAAYAPPPQAPVVLVPLRPRSCGKYRYWNGEYCADARYERPYVGPKS
jgi:hypothetical protein